MDKNAVQKCRYSEKCGGCRYIGEPYEETLKRKLKQVRKLLKVYGRVEKITGMEDPYHYRNKVHRVCSYERAGRREFHISGIYREGTHKIVQVKNCLIEDERADAVIADILKLAKDFKIRNYNEDTGDGLLRHILIRTAHATGQIMAVLVLAKREFPGKKHFVKALLGLHPEITTVVFNFNSRRTNMILGNTESVAYGPGFIEDVLCGNTFRISPASFYQVNSMQTEKLYETAISFAELKGREHVLDAYCGIGTIGMTASSHCAAVTGVENNAEAVKDARSNAGRNKIGNARFVCADAGTYLKKAAAEGKKPDVLFMDPPRAGASAEFLAAAAKVRPEKIVYISCNPETLARDLGVLTEDGYRLEQAECFDLFPFTQHVETVCCLKKRKPDAYHI